jgi:hypothetical protein
MARMSRKTRLLHILFCLGAAGALTGCSSLFGATDSYGNTYGDWYNPGQNYQWQLQACEQETASPKIPLASRSQHMRCCMHAHGVPVDNPQACTA